MCQVLFWIPIQQWLGRGWDIPIYGYGTMLFLAFVLCTWLACRLGDKEGYPKERIQDLAIWIFVTGILGARLTFMIQERRSIWEFFAIWDGGLVFYGSFIGGAVGFGLAYVLFLRQYNGWKLVDIIAPCIALGLALGRVGCLLNGCCYGNVACEDCPSVHFPLSSPPRYTFVERGLQTAADFTTAGRTTVGKVMPHSAAEQAGLRADDQITRINGKEVESGDDVVRYLVREWERGKNDLVLTVKRDGEEITLPAYRPVSLPLHPTQIYETISMVLLMFVLLAYYPLKKRDGSVFILFMLAYALHRFLNEMLRTDNTPVAFDMTLSQNLSVLMVFAALLLALIVWRRGPTQPLSPTSEAIAPAPST